MKRLGEWEGRKERIKETGESGREGGRGSRRLVRVGGKEGEDQGDW